MEPICYYVHFTRAGWVARFDSYGMLQHFTTRERAVAVATDAAQTRWEVLGKAGCVKIEEIDGSVVTHAHFG